ncbi:MAG TPA: CHAD domain-containing protein [Chitinophagaceae bacterium]|nr:CHAD domain-containing protein [Chitinophagaceae bacterium]
MKHRELKADIEARFSDIDKRLCRVLDGFDPEDIHLFRVEVKKLRALLYMLNSEHGSLIVRRKLPQRLRKFYHFAGDVRTLQLQRQYILNALKGTGHAQPWTYLNSLDIVMTDKMGRARELLHGHHTFQKEKEYILEGLPERVGRKLPDRYTDKQIHAFWRQVSIDPPDEKALHEARRILKDLLYNWQYFDTYTIEKVTESISGKNNIQTLANLLGIIHDAATGVSLLNDESIQHITGERERMLLLAIKEQWAQEKDRVKQEIYEQLFISNHHV